MSSEIFPPDEVQQQPQTGCANCNHPVIEPGYPTPLCADCRQKFIRYPIPIGIKIFGACVAVLVIVAMFNISKNLRAGVHYERGVDAVEARKYVTAERELKLALQEIPAYTEGKMYLALAAFNNQDMLTFYQLMQELEGKQVDDDWLYKSLTDVSARAINYVPSDSFLTLLDKYKDVDSIPPAEMLNYMQHNPEEIFARSRYANYLLDKEQYTSCDSLLTEILQKDPGYPTALYLMTANKRKMKDYDSSIFYSERIISYNRESAYGISSKARTMLMQKKDREALQWALNGVKADENNPYSKATLVLAYHFNHKMTERDQLIDQMKKDSTGAIYVQYPLDIISGKENFRD